MLQACFQYEASNEHLLKHLVGTEATNLVKVNNSRTALGTLKLNISVRVQK